MTKRKFKINFVDVLAVILIIALGVAVYFAISSGFFTGGNKNEVTLRCVMKSSPVDTDLAAMLTKGNTLYMADGKSEIGIVSAVEVRPAMHTGSDGNGVVISEIEGQSCLYITVDIKAEYDGKSYKLDETNISVGLVLDVVSPELAVEAELISIEKIN